MPKTERQVGLSLLLPKITHGPGGQGHSDLCLPSCGSLAFPPLLGETRQHLSTAKPWVTAAGSPSGTVSWDLWVAPPHATTLKTRRCTICKGKSGEELSKVPRECHVGSVVFNPFYPPLLLTRDIEWRANSHLNLIHFVHMNFTLRIFYSCTFLSLQVLCSL